MIAQRNQRGTQQYLCKWGKLGYSECTWEPEDALSSKADRAEVARFKRFCKAAAERHSSKAPKDTQKGHQDHRKLPPPEFLNGMMLRDYQVESYRWMISNFRMGKSVILGDEMGLGKTAQSVSVVEQIRSYESGIRARRPALIIVPLTTVGHWRREIERWTDMNAVVYTGSADDLKAREETSHCWTPRKSPCARATRQAAALAQLPGLLQSSARLFALQPATAD